MIKNRPCIGILIFLLVSFFHYLNGKEVDNDISYRIIRNDYTFSTVFELATDKHLVGSVVKSVFSIATHYEAYDRFGLYEGQGISRLFSLGLFYTWGTEIDVYNADGDKIGMIDGQVMSSEPAKFSFYDETGKRTAIGYLDQNCMGFSLVDPNNSALVLARLTRNFIVDTVDNWDVVIYSPDRISSNLIKIFAAFVCDTQDKFKPDR